MPHLFLPSAILSGFLLTGALLIGCDDPQTEPLTGLRQDPQHSNVYYMATAHDLSRVTLDTTDGLTNVFRHNARVTFAVDPLAIAIQLRRYADFKISSYDAAGLLRHPDPHRARAGRTYWADAETLQTLPAGLLPLRPLSPVR